MNGFEWIVVDGSIDPDVRRANREILLERNVNLVQSPDDGRFDAMNKGLRKATGKIVCFLNSGDCFATEETVQNVCESYLKHRWGWAVGDTIAVNDLGDHLWSWPMPKHGSMKLLLGINSYCHQATFVEIKFFDELGEFEIDSLYSDWVFSLKLSKVSPPFKLLFTTTQFLANGISSNQTIDYWRSESSKLRRRNGVLIFNSRWIDNLLQNFAANFIRTTRGQLIRPDLVEKYP